MKFRAKRRWTAAYAGVPLGDALHHKPSLGLVSIDAPVWDDKELCENVRWGMFESAGEAERSAKSFCTLYLVLCEPSHIGYDPITTEYEGTATLDPTQTIIAKGLKYCIVETLHTTGMICGKVTTVTIKDFSLYPIPKRFSLQRRDTLESLKKFPSFCHVKPFASNGKEDNTKDFLGEDFWKTCCPRGRYYSKKSQPLPRANRVHKRYVFRGCGIPIDEFRNKKELLKVLIGVIRAHKTLTENGMLHRDISTRNLMMRSDGPDHKGLLIDFDMMTMIDEGNCGEIIGPRGTVPFMSLDVFKGGKAHSASDDLESFFLSEQHS
ncbi:hypothetical protein AMATHDRAFT_5991 [Amanita thiersii Skay4041]|uniref:Protein kinase domain-containing protein n=1 Tax=Amanita thiersii Skay4041 TaxID=703135 RepID=A0A2A9NIW2_9AGAR|nr:hypothetical protein AMATHDRAFT_5991 [Amanita thiersii Skay4041]